MRGCKRIARPSEDAVKRQKASSDAHSLLCPQLSKEIGESVARLSGQDLHGSYLATTLGFESILLVLKMLTGADSRIEKHGDAQSSYKNPNRIKLASLT